MVLKTQMTWRFRQGSLSCKVLMLISPRQVSRGAQSHTTQGKTGKSSCQDAEECSKSSRVGRSSSSGGQNRGDNPGPLPSTTQAPRSSQDRSQMAGALESSIPPARQGSSPQPGSRPVSQIPEIESIMSGTSGSAGFLSLAANSGCALGISTVCMGCSSFRQLSAFGD